MTNKNFSEQIKIWRKSKGYTQKEAAQLFGVCGATVGYWERGGFPTNEFRNKISEVLGIDKDILFQDREPKNFKELLRAKRIEACLTQDELASILGYSRATIHKWEQGSAKPCYFAMQDVCSYFGIEMEQ